MRKKMLTPTRPAARSAAADWLDLEQAAEVELTSEDAGHPIESALGPGEGPGWRAAAAGPQVIRLHFDVPQRLRRVRLVFQEHEVDRAQEFALRCSTDGGQSYRDVVRQQYNFSPPGTTREVEEYEVDLAGVSTLELSIVPDVGGGPHPASLAEWRVATSAARV